MAIFGQGDEHVDIREAPDIAKYYDTDDELDAISVCGSAPQFFHVRYYLESAAARVVLSVFPADPAFVIDNDHGVLMSLKAFDGLIRAQPGWLWSSAEAEPE
jgi:hypothetical protein